MFSIKKKLSRYTILTTLILTTLSAITTVFIAREEAKEIYDEHLIQSTRIILFAAQYILQDNPELRQNMMANWQQQSDLFDAIDKEFAPDDSHPSRSLVFQIIDANNRIIIKSPLAPTTPLSTQMKAGFISIDMGQKRWRAFIVEHRIGNRDYRIITAEDRYELQELLDEISLSTLLIHFFLVLLLGAFSIAFVKRFLQPLEDLKTAIAQKNINDLKTIFVPKNTVELSPVVEQINELFNRLALSIEREKRFSNTAAHELKTPLTILRINAENALAAENKQQLNDDLGRIIGSIDRSDRLISQLLMLSRIEGIRRGDLDRVCIDDTLKAIIIELTPIILKREQQIAFDGCSDIYVVGHENLLRSLFNNLIDNASRYSGNGSSIDVHIARRSSSIEITVTDSGKRINDTVRERMFERFFRGNSERGDGAGLGMSIVLEILSLHRGTITLVDSDVGNRFLITLPACE